MSLDSDVTAMRKLVAEQPDALSDDLKATVAREWTYAELSDAVARLVAAGVVVVLASGRMYPGTARIAHHLELDGPLICQQGASVHRADASLLHRFEYCASLLTARHEFAMNGCIMTGEAQSDRIGVTAHDCGVLAR